MQVVAAVIQREERILACQRRKEGAFPLKWEFPGGKVGAGEESITALRRELREELGVEIATAQQIHHCRHRYAGGLDVELTFFYVDHYQGTLTNLAFEQILWMEPGRLEELDFLEADLPLVRRIAQGQVVCFH